MRSHRQDRDARRARGAVELGVADPGRARHLAVASLASQLQHELVHLPEAGRAHRLPVGDEPAVGVHRQAAADLRCPFGQQLLLLPSAQKPFSAMWMTSAPASVSWSCTTSTSSGLRPASSYAARDAYTVGASTCSTAAHVECTSCAP